MGEVINNQEQNEVAFKDSVGFKFSLPILVSVTLILAIIAAIVYHCITSIVEKEVVNKQLPNASSLVANKVINYIEPYIGHSITLAEDTYFQQWIANKEPEDGIATYRDSVEHMVKKYDLHDVIIQQYGQYVNTEKGERGALLHTAYLNEAYPKYG